MKIYEVSFLSYHVQQGEFIKGKRAVWASTRLNAIETCVNSLFQSYLDLYLDCCIEIKENDRGHIKKVVISVEGEKEVCYFDFKTKFLYSQESEE